MRQVVLDTETTGLATAEDHRIIEVGAVELVDRRPTGRNFHHYLNPEREIDPGAQEVHGITREFLADKPRFAAIAEELVDYLEGAELVIHNAAFDIGFIDHELKRWNRGYGSILAHCSVLDTLKLAREKHPGQRNSLDALCRRYDVDNSNRDLHGALLDARILADVYLAMTGGQTALALTGDSANQRGERGADALVQGPLPEVRVLRANDTELALHESRLDALERQSGSALWRQLATRSEIDIEVG